MELSQATAAPPGGCLATPGRGRLALVRELPALQGDAMVLRRSVPTDPQAAITSFWTGRYADFLAERGEVVPAWAWVNAVARGNTLVVASLAIASVAPVEEVGSLRPWYRARRVMALFTMEHVVTLGCSLEDLQTHALQGLELELAATAGVFERGPTETATLVREALNAFRPPP